MLIAKDLRNHIDKLSTVLNFDSIRDHSMKYSLAYFVSTPEVPLSPQFSSLWQLIEVVMVLAAAILLAMVVAVITKDSTCSAHTAADLVILDISASNCMDNLIALSTLSTHMLHCRHIRRVLISEYHSNWHWVCIIPSVSGCYITTCCFWIVAFDAQTSSPTVCFTPSSPSTRWIWDWRFWCNSIRLFTLRSNPQFRKSRQFQISPYYIYFVFNY